MIFIAEVDGIKQIRGAAGLLNPIASAIGCPQDYAAIAYDGADIGIDEVHSEKVYPDKWIAYSTVLP